jgi:probable transmembrane transport protein cj0948c
MKIQQKATIIATTTAFFLAILKLSVGIFSGSIAILASAIDSLLDMGISIFNFVAVKNS